MWVGGRSSMLPSPNQTTLLRPCTSLLPESKGLFVPIIPSTGFISLALLLALVGCGGDGGGGDASDSVGPPFAKLRDLGIEISCESISLFTNGASFNYSERTESVYVASEGGKVLTATEMTSFHEGDACDLASQADVSVTHPTTEAIYEGTSVVPVLRSNGLVRQQQVSRIRTRTNTSGETLITGSDVVSTEKLEDRIKVVLRIGEQLVPSDVLIEPSKTDYRGLFIEGGVLLGLAWDAEQARYFEE